jgi:mRNA interferase MazF
VVRVAFPFSDATGAKERYAVVLSTDDYHHDWNELLVVALTSRIPANLRPTDYLLQDWQAAGLTKPSLMRSHLATVDYRLIQNKVGAVTARDLSSVEATLKRATGL